MHPQDLSARHYLRELVDEIASFHAKFKTLRTLRDLLAPGLLTAECTAREAAGLHLTSESNQ